MMMDDVIRDRALVVLDFAKDVEGLRQWSAIARAFVLALVYLADSIQAAARVAQALEEER